MWSNMRTDGRQIYLWLYKEVTCVQNDDLISKCLSKWRGNVHRLMIRHMYLVFLCTFGCTNISLYGSNSGQCHFNPRDFKLCLYFGLIFFRVVSVPRSSIALGFVAGSSISFVFVLVFVLSPGSPFTFSCVLLFCDSIFLQIINIFIFRKYLLTID
jgi:hypothetical protein